MCAATRFSMKGVPHISNKKSLSAVGKQRLSFSRSPGLSSSSCNIGLSGSLAGLCAVEIHACGVDGLPPKFEQPAHDGR